jgi:hypothetical protein
VIWLAAVFQRRLEYPPGLLERVNNDRRVSPRSLVNGKIVTLVVAHSASLGCGIGFPVFSTLE